MVIECPACKTKFKLPDEKIGPAGVSVRCSKCTTTFAVRPPAAAAASAPAPDHTVVSARLPPEPPPQPPTPPPAAPSGVPDLFGNDDFATQTALSTPQQPPSVTPTGFGGMTNAFAAGIASSAGGAPVPPAMPPPAGFGTPFVNMDVTQASGPPASGRQVVPPDDPTTLHAEDGVSDVQPGLDESVRASLLGTNAPGSSLSEEGDQGLPPDEARTGGAANFDFGTDPFAGGAPANGGPRPAAPPAELFAARPQTIHSPPPAAESVGLAEPAKADKTGTAKKKKAVPRMATAFIDAPREPARAYRVLLALFFAGAFASAFASLTDGSFDFRRVDRGRLSLLIGPPKAPEGIDGLAITARRGGYVTTSPGKPRVYAAHGVAINAGGASKGFLEVRGRMLDASGGVLAEATVPCGNSFRDDQLLGFRSGDELRRAYLPAGDGMSNQKVAPGAAVACTVVFFEAPSPDKTAAFDLEIVAAQPAS